jgi:hypothetical protein
MQKVKNIKAKRAQNRKYWQTAGGEKGEGRFLAPYLDPREELQAIPRKNGYAAFQLLCSWTLLRIYVL